MQTSASIYSDSPKDFFTEKTMEKQRIIISEGEEVADDSKKAVQNEMKEENKVVVDDDPCTREVHLIANEQCDEETAGNPKFQVKDSVFARDGAGIYEAIVEKIACKASSDSHVEWVYLMHFKGWSKRHDKWISESLIMEPTEEAQRLAREFQAKEARRKEESTRQKKDLLQKKKAKNSRKTINMEDSIISEADSQETGLNKKRRKQSEIASKKTCITANTKKEGECVGKDSFDKKKVFLSVLKDLPLSLKSILINDREKIVAPHPDNAQPPSPCEWNCRRCLVQLPASVTIMQCFRQYFDHKNEQRQASTNSALPSELKKEKRKLRFMIKGLATLFDDALPVFLLYRQERKQYKILQKQRESAGEADEIRNIEIYGCEHLLRLLVKLPCIFSLVPPSSLKTTSDDLVELEGFISDLIQFLQSNATALFKATYRPPEDRELTKLERRQRKEQLSISAPVEMAQKASLSETVRVKEDERSGQ